MIPISDQRRAELTRIGDLLSGMAPEEGLDMATQIFPELIEAYTELVDLREEYNASLAAICELAHALGFNPDDAWDHDSCPNNSEMVHELISHVELMIAKELAGETYYDAPAAAPFRELAIEATRKHYAEDKRSAGIVAKFQVTRVDGQSAPGGKHHVCQYFVLDLNCDPHAKPAILAYADSCEKDGYKALGADLRGFFEPPDHFEKDHFDRVPDISEPYPTGVVIYPSEATPFLVPALEAAAHEITGKSIKAINRRIAMARLENIKSLEDPRL